MVALRSGPGQLDGVPVGIAIGVAFVAPAVDDPVSGVLIQLPDGWVVLTDVEQILDLAVGLADAAKALRHHLTAGSN